MKAHPLLSIIIGAALLLAGFYCQIRRTADPSWSHGWEFGDDAAEPETSLWGFFVLGFAATEGYFSWVGLTCYFG